MKESRQGVWGGSLKFAGRGSLFSPQDYLKRTGYSEFIFAEVPVELWEISHSI